MGGFWLHPYSFIITGLLLLAGTQYEYYLMVRNTGVRLQIVTGMLTGVVVYVISTLVASGILPSVWFLVLIPLVALIMISELYRKTEKPFDSLAHTFFGVLYCCSSLFNVPFCCLFQGRS